MTCIRSYKYVLGRGEKLNVLLNEQYFMEDRWIRPNCNSLPWEVSNGLEEFCQTYSIGKTMAQNNRWFRKETLKNATLKQGHFFYNALGSRFCAFPILFLAVCLFKLYTVQLLWPNTEVTEILMEGRLITRTSEFSKSHYKEYFLHL